MVHVVKFQLKKNTTIFFFFKVLLFGMEHNRCEERPQQSSKPLPPKKDDNIQIYMLNCHNKVMCAYIITKCLENTQLMCGATHFFIAWRF
jgi:hypothetical protein